MLPITPSPETLLWLQKSRVQHVVYRGEHGQAPGQGLHSKLGSLTFSQDPAIASTYALSPNDYRDQVIAPRVIPAFVRITNPIVDNPDDPFMDLGPLMVKLGRDEVVRIALKFAAHLEHTNFWDEDLAPIYGSIASLIQQAPERLAELYMDAYPYLDDPDEVQRLKAAGYDGAIHGGNGESALTQEFRAFSEEQVCFAFSIPPATSTPTRRRRSTP